MASAEWILEAPTVGSIVPTPNYGHVTFDPVSANGMNPNLSLAADGIIMQDPYGETSNPSEAAGGDSFSVCWGAIGAGLTACTFTPFNAPPPPMPTATLSASPSKIPLGGTSVLFWSSTNSTSCAGSGFGATGLSGSVSVAPTGTTTYAVTCSDDVGDAARASATVTIQPCHGKKCGGSAPKR